MREDWQRCAKRPRGTESARESESVIGHVRGRENAIETGTGTVARNRRV